MSKLTSNQDKSNSALAYVWRKYREYALTSRKRKAELTAWRFRIFIFGITGAILGTICQESIRLGFNDISNLSWVPFILGFSSAAAIGLAIISYQTTANKLEQLHVLWESKGKTDNDTDARNKFIRECEAAISIENSAWMAEIEMAK
jgi:hypothetical protein